MKKTLLFIFLFSASNLFAQTFSTGTQTLLTNLSVKVDIDSETNMTTLTLAGPSNAWFAIGFGGLNMSSGADVFRTNGTEIIDARTTGRFLPPEDASQDWSLVSNTVSGPTRTIIATRANDTGDANDFVFDPNATSLSIIYAHGTSTSYTKHSGSNRGFTTLGVTLGINENNMVNFNIFPNPASDEVNIQLPTGADRAKVYVLDYFGRLISSQTVNLNNTSVNIMDLSSGIYLIRVSTGTEVGIKRFIKR